MHLLKNPIKIGLFGTLTLLLGTSVWSGYQVFSKSNERVAIQKDYSIANSITFGIFSASEWKNEVKQIVSKKISDFEFNKRQDSLARAQIKTLLHKLLTEVKTQVNQKDETLEDKIRKVSADILVDWEKLRKNIPEYTDAILQKLKAEGSKDRLKTIIQSKLDELAAQTYDPSDSLRLQKMYDHYGANNQEAFKDIVSQRISKLEKLSERYTYILLGILGFLLILWIMLWRQKSLHPLLFTFSILMGLVVLLAGLTTPMIEIDARIEAFELVLLSNNISFEDQVLFYRSKSILEVVNLLLQSPRFDAILVGFLILAFSVLLPFSKLSANGFYLFTNSGFRGNKIVRWLTFNSGKWSMADVIVVAIFMAFVGFERLIDDQLALVSFQKENISSVTTNNTALLNGFTLFLSFVIFSLLLSEILGRLNKSDQTSDL